MEPHLYSFSTWNKSIIETQTLFVVGFQICRAMIPPDFLRSAERPDMNPDSALFSGEMGGCAHAGPSSQQSRCGGPANPMELEKLHLSPILAIHSFVLGR
jgi:hypothetical protein